MDVAFIMELEPLFYTLHKFEFTALCIMLCITISFVAFEFYSREYKE